MPFFQNPFGSDFYGVWLLGDRQHSVDFKCPRNAGRSDEFVVAHNRGPYDLSGNDADGNSKAILTVTFALRDQKNWADLSIDVSGSAPAATTSHEIVAALLSNETFSSFFTVTTDRFQGLTIKQTKPVLELKFFVRNGQAETAIQFNKLSGVSELPTFFSRHTVENRFIYRDSQNAILELDPSLNVDAAIINGAVDEKGVDKGFSSSTVHADYELLRGRSGIFNFYKNTVDSSNRITETIEYPAGAIAGDMARKTTFSYTSTNTQPDKRVEIPYTLTDADLVTP